MYHKKRNFPWGTSIDYYKVIYATQWFLALDFFLYYKVKETVKYFFRVWFLDHGLLVKNNEHWNTFQMIYNMTMFRKKNFFFAYQLWRHNILYLTWNLIFLAFWNHSVLLRIGQYTKSNLMTYNLKMFEKIFFVAIVINDVICI